MSDREHEQERKARRDQHHVRALEAERARTRFAIRNTTRYDKSNTMEDDDD